MNGGHVFQKRRTDGTFGDSAGDLSERFFSHVKMPGGCWEWNGRLNRGGYGEFKMDGKVVMAHRASLIVMGRRLNPSSVVMHRCDNRRCVRPDHLQVGTQSENMRDCWRKGRGRSPLTKESSKGIIL